MLRKTWIYPTLRHDLGPEQLQHCLVMPSPLRAATFFSGQPTGTIVQTERVFVLRRSQKRATISAICRPNEEEQRAENAHNETMQRVRLLGAYGVSDGCGIGKE